MTVYVDKARQDTFAAVILIGRLSAVRIDGRDLAILKLDLRCDELIGQPNLFTLDNHFYLTSCSPDKSQAFPPAAFGSKS